MEVAIILGTIYIGYFILDAYNQRKLKRKIKNQEKIHTDEEDFNKNQPQQSIKSNDTYVTFEESGLTDYKKWYNEIYLYSPHWINAKKRIIKRADYKCQLCGKRKKLSVHHNTYNNIGHEYTSDLIALCEDCHNMYHRNNNSK
ncbi:HNH endonuclease [Clostridium botulinum]|uniref:HNH endonuclease n=1 Tax=Clostridium botulinum TaxID=1491 RepID=UPI0022471D86|nr:HNH endonuclease signature motif containing protein [Clostridium botulinum]UZP01952.1 HNH endonuclease [Clostridium botulinum]UZP05310.1 HNH endonuclease [Clostridium botulinum]UZP08691.1 HNH endonuclease [Clostridium botulinum]